MVAPEDGWQLGVSKNEQVAIEFYSASDWIAKVDADWLTVSPMTGRGGKNTSIAVIAKETNMTVDERSATLTISTNYGSVPLAIVQKAADVLTVEQTVYEVPAEGGEVTINFTTSLVDKYAQLWSYTSNVTDWIEPVKDADMNTKALIDDSFVIRVLPNDTREERVAVFQIALSESAESDDTDIVTPRITIRQAGSPVGTSVDLVTDDKK